MKDFIWYSVPGIIFAVSLLLFIDPDVWMIAILPLIGFIIHQSMRTIFEALLGGFRSKKRKVIRDIMQIEYPLLNNERAFLVWETAFYSKIVHDSFREHDRGAWHYILSFYSCMLASTLGVVVILIAFKSNNISFLSLVSFVFGYAVFCFLFYLKASLTRTSLEEQESAIFRLHEDDFKKIAMKLYCE